MCLSLFKGVSHLHYLFIERIIKYEHTETQTKIIKAICKRSKLIESYKEENDVTIYNSTQEGSPLNYIYVAVIYKCQLMT